MRTAYPPSAGRSLSERVCTACIHAPYQQCPFPAAIGHGGDQWLCTRQVNSQRSDLSSPMRPPVSDTLVPISQSTTKGRSLTVLAVAALLAYLLPHLRMRMGRRSRSIRSRTARVSTPVRCRFMPGSCLAALRERLPSKASGMLWTRMLVCGWTGSGSGLAGSTGFTPASSGSGMVIRVV